MKNRLTRILSSILILAMLLSAFAMTVLATDSGEGEGSGETGEDDPTGGVTAVYNRGFEEGWDYGNGITAYPRSQKFSIEYEENENFEYNYFMRLEGLTNTDYGYFDIFYGGNAPRDGYSVFEYDVMTDDVLENLGTLVQMRHTSSGSFTQLASITNQQLLLIGSNSATYNKSSTNIGDTGNTTKYVVGNIDNNWIHIAYVFNFDTRACKVCHKAYSDAGLTEEDVLCTECNQKVVEMDEAIGITVYYGYADTFNAENAVYNIDVTGSKDLSKTYKYDTMYVMPDGGSATIFSLRFALNNKPDITFCLDNLRIYNGSSAPIADLDPEIYGYGSNVSTNEEKTIDILTSANSKTDLEYIEEGLAMKLNVNYALYAGEKKAILTDNSGNIYGAPVKIDGKVYLPLQAILDYIGFPVFAHADGVSYDISTSNGSAFIAIGRDTATVNGELRQLKEAPNYIRDNTTGNTYLVIALEDVDTIFDGYHAEYDEMGLVLITEAKYDKNGEVIDAVNRSTKLDVMLDLMKKFVVEYVGGDDYYSLVKENTAFAHPYLLADQNTFNSLNIAYNAKDGDENYDENLKKYLDEYIVGAKEVYEIYAAEDGSGYIGIKDDVNMSNPYAAGTNNGYSSSGYLKEAAAHNESIKVLALAYQITREAKYADLAYDMAVAMASWEHWGPAYIIDLANAATPYALAYDWLYNVWTADEEKDISIIEKAIYEKVLTEGYNASNAILTSYPRKLQDTENEYTTMTDHWNATTTTAMVLSSLALLGSKELAVAEERIGDNTVLYDNITATAKWLIENNIKTLVENGLDAYAPDGSFFAGPEYWQYTTDAFVTMTWAIMDATGDDMGLLDLWGYYDTFYYAIYIEYNAVSGEVAGEIEKFNSGYTYWNYHDAIAGELDTSAFFFATEAFGDNTFAAYRVMQLESKPIGYLDLLGYKKEYTTLEASDFELELDHEFEGCEGYVARDGFERGSLYAGIMANVNAGDLGQIDSGNFIYANKGYTWFVDTGAENTGVYDYFGKPDNRYSYYRMNAEGANVVCITTAQSTVPFGQVANVGGTVVEYESNEHGMYVIIDNKAVYGDTLVEGHARRGMLVTNDRSTVVIQDEVKFDQVQTAYWIGHTAASIEITADGQTAYLTQTVNGEQVILRASLVSKMSYSFDTIPAAEEYLLNTTMKTGQSKNAGGEDEYARTSLQRLIIKSSEQMSFECAVVLEIVEDKGEDDKAPVQYEWVDMENWVISESFESTAVEERNALMTDISDYSAKAGSYLKNGTAFNEQIGDFYAALCMVAAAEETYRPAQIKEIKEIYSDYLDFLIYREQYRAYMNEINMSINAQKVTANGLGGIQQ